MKVRPMGAELFHAGERTDGQTDRHVEANSRISQFCERSKTGCEAYEPLRHLLWYFL